MSKDLLKHIGLKICVCHINTIFSKFWDTTPYCQHSPTPNKQDYLLFLLLVFFCLLVRKLNFIFYYVFIAYLTTVEVVCVDKSVEQHPGVQHEDLESLFCSAILPSVLCKVSLISCRPFFRGVVLLKKLFKLSRRKQKASVILETYEINNGAVVKLYSLFKFILFYHYKDLTERISEVGTDGADCQQQ